MFQTARPDVPSLRLAILVVTYLLIAAQGLPWLRLTHPAASLLGAVAMVTIGGLALRDAYAAIDMDVIVFLLRVLLLTAYLALGGFFEWIASRIVRYAHVPRFHDAGVVSAAMLALSNLVSNVPAVILWLPVVPRTTHPAFVWLVMAMSSTFAGNLTLIGSMANLIVAERAGTRGARIGFVDYLKVGVPTTIATMLWGILWIVILA